MARTSATLASVCGTISEFVADGAQNGSLVLDSPGRAPLKVTIPAGRLGGSASGYVCIGLLAGVPYPLFDGFFPQGTPGFVERGTVPATTAVPAPTGLVLPQACAYVAPPLVGTVQTDWSIDCGAANNSNARGTLGPAFTQQGWTSCGAGLGTERWRKNDVMLSVSESSLAPGDYPQLAQVARVTSSCS
ncbi:MAG: hypothetical protein M3P38_10560 [Chloroflexota bacterium]|nr:hypothetical protein [Chloroflexota bacterium]